MKDIRTRALFVSLSCISLLFVSLVHADKQWHGSSVDNVIDEDLVINGDVELPKGGTIIEAANRDVKVTLNKKAFVRGNDDGESQLYIVASDGHTVQFIIDHDLTFLGSTEDEDTPLLIVQSGGGKVKYELFGGNTLSFTKDVDSSGTEYWVFMDSCVEYTGDTVLAIERSDKESLEQKAKNVEVVVGKKSLLSYLSPELVSLHAVSCATIQFDPSNNAQGRMVLSVENTGGVIISGHKVDEIDPTKVTLGDIDKSTPAGLSAALEIVNSQGSSAHAGLLVLNKNNTVSELLADPFLTLGTRSGPWHTGSFTGKRWGWVLGSNGTLNITDNSYLDYVGLRLDVAPPVKSIPGYEDLHAEQLLKKRNPSAFTVDGNHNPDAGAAQTIFGHNAALFLRSGVDFEGSIWGLNHPHAFTVDQDMRTPGIGNAVLVVEGEWDLRGELDSGQSSAKVEILSLEVTKSGGPLFIDGNEKNFPRRTFAKDHDGRLRAYNTAYALINDRMNLINVSLVHTDRNHRVVKKNSALSEPTYVGGETFKLLDRHDDDASDLCKIMARPKIAFENGRLLVHESLAITGVDFLVANQVDANDMSENNRSEFVFHHNGFKVDDGTGRDMILGTLIGSGTIDSGCGSIEVSAQAHIDVLQTKDSFDVSSPDDGGNHTLEFSIAPNNHFIRQEIVGDVTHQISTHDIFMNRWSNISIGTNADKTGFESDTCPWMRIRGNSFAFETGSGSPKDVGVTGRGGIFVDLNGHFSVDPGVSTTINTMVTKSRNASVKLPKRQVLFNNGVGMTVWQPDLSEKDNCVFIDAGEEISDFSLNWTAVQKDCKNFVPYPVVNSSFCGCTEVTSENVSSLPTFKGEVDQLQIQGSRYSDPAHVKVDGGNVRELVFLQGSEPGEFAGAVVVLENNGQVGIGSASRNLDSVKAATKLGRNGVTFIVNRGGGRINLHDNLTVEGACSILLGPDFDPTTDSIEVTSSGASEVVVESSGLFDMRGITQGAVLNLTGSARLVMEPGSKMFLGGGTIRFSDRSALAFRNYSHAVESFFNAIPLGPVDNNLDATKSTPASAPHNELAPLTEYGKGLRNTDPFRVRLIGTGMLEFADDSRASLMQDTFVGIETIDEIENTCGQVVIPTTDLTIRLKNSAHFSLGSEGTHERGGALQVGNVVNLFGHSVSFTVELAGKNAKLTQGPCSFIGFNVGLARAGVATANEYLVDTLYNVSGVTVNHLDGAWKSDRIYSGDSEHASLFAIGDTGSSSYNFTYGDNVDPFFDIFSGNMNVHGGGNFMLVTPGDEDNLGVMHPVVRDFAGITDNPRMTAGMFASLLLRTDGNNPLTNPTDLLTASELFDAWNTGNAAVQGQIATGRANAGAADEGFLRVIGQIRVGTNINGIFERQTFKNADVLGSVPQRTDALEAVELAAVSVDIEGPPATDGDPNTLSMSNPRITL